MSHSRRSGERQRSGIAVETVHSPSSLCSCCAVVLSDATALLQPASAPMSPMKASLSLGVSRWIQSRGTSCLLAYRATLLRSVLRYCNVLRNIITDPLRYGFSPYYARTEVRNGNILLRPTVYRVH